MKISKQSGSYDLYRAELSWAELNAVIGSLDASGTGAVSDELLAGFKWYMEKLPKPGEEEDDEKETTEKSDEGELTELPAPDAEIELEEPEVVPEELPAPTEGEDIDMALDDELPEPQLEV